MPGLVTVDREATPSNSIGDDDHIASNGESGARGSADIEEDSHTVSIHRVKNIRANSQI